MVRMISVYLTLCLLKYCHSCLPNGGLLGGLGLGSPSGCGCSTCPCTSPSYAAPPPPPQQPAYAYAPQQPPPIVLPPSPIVSPSSSFQGQYLDKPMINPAYQGKAPLGFPGESMPTAVISASNDQSPQVVNPFEYLEHVSVSHVPQEYPNSQPESFGKLAIHQIEVAPSSEGEDTYTTPSDNSSNTVDKPMVTYYNQICAGEKITTGEKETINSATQKCEMLKCVAANAQSDSFGTYTVTFLKSATSRTNKKGNYCLSSIQLPAKSKRVIRRFDDMIANDQADRLRRFLLHRRRLFV